MASLSCSGLWKVFGKLPAGGIEPLVARSGSTDEAAARLRELQCFPAVCDVGFEVARSEIFVIMGLSGSGKSTVIRCLSRLVEPTLGRVVLDGEEITGLPEKKLISLRRNKMSMVFQHFGLMPHLNVLENVAFPLRVQGKPPADRRRRAVDMIRLVGLAGREEAFPRELSGGMQQRVGIARSLAVEPDIWFLDEPFSALDPLIRRQMQDEFLRLQSTLKKTIVFITHDFSEALRLADRIAIMRDGRIEQIGTPLELVMRPASGYVAEFTKDVPREKILTVASISDPAPNGSGGETIDGDTRLDAAMPRLVGRRNPLLVTDRRGQVVGQVTADSILAALAGRVAS